MIVFPNTKINLGLNILYKRPDGFHEIETVFYPLPFADILEIIPGRFAFGHLKQTGIPLDCLAEDNLVFRAYRQLKDRFDLPEAGLHLHKIVPFGAGLGGGSADAAYTLRVMNKLFDLQLSNQELEQEAQKLGSDCAFFIRNRAVFACGRGADFTEVSFSLKGYYLLLIIPPVSVSTAEAYAGIKPAMPEQSIQKIIQEPVRHWKGLLKNDFENPVFSKHSDLSEIKEALYASGALYASMTGSGSALFGIYDSVPEAISEKLERYIYWRGWL